MANRSNRAKSDIADLNMTNWSYDATDMMQIISGDMNVNYAQLRLKDQMSVLDRSKP